MSKQKAPFADSFMLLLVIIAIIGMLWLFWPFLPALFFAMLVAIASYKYFLIFSSKAPKAIASLVMSFLVLIIIIIPITYILLIASAEASKLIIILQNNFTTYDISALISTTVSSVPLPDKLTNIMMSSIKNYAPDILLVIKDILIFILQSIANFSFNFVIFILISIFALFYLYLDGEKLVQKIRYLTPIDNKLDDILIIQFAQLAVTLVGSTFIIAILQGISFAIGVAFIGLPALFFGLTMAIAGFIPIVGGLIVWLPLSVYLFINEAYIAGIFIIILGGGLIGGLIDNIIRPIIIKKLSSRFNQPSALNHTFITVLSTIAGIVQMGILGLFIGPIIAAMAISIFNAYSIKYKNFLDNN